MRITREANPEEIKKYEHIKAAPTFGPVRCFTKMPGSHRTCTLSAGHDGPHMAHGGWRFRKVYAVWDNEERFYGSKLRGTVLDLLGLEDTGTDETPTRRINF